MRRDEEQERVEYLADEAFESLEKLCLVGSGTSTSASSRSRSSVCVMPMLLKSPAR